MANMDEHLTYMRQTIELAEYALRLDETPIACLLVHPATRTILSHGINDTNRSYNGTRHAEVLCFARFFATAVAPHLQLVDARSQPETPGTEARPPDPRRPSSSSASSSPTRLSSPSLPPPPPPRRSRHAQLLREATLYVTVEPCIMCAALLRQVGVRRVVFGAANDKFGGCGGVLDIHVANGWKELVAGVVDSTGHDGPKDGGDISFDAGAAVSHGANRGQQTVGDRHADDYEVVGGVMREEAILLLRRFYVQENDRAPEPRSKKGRVLKTDIEPLAGT